MQVIHSKENETIKRIKKLKEKKYRDLWNHFLIEGVKLIKEAIQEKVTIREIVVCEECMQDGTLQQDFLYEIAKYECIYVSKPIFSTLTEVTTPQGILAVVEKPNQSQVDYQEELVLALDGVQDPGNLGTILRTADSTNVKQILLSKQTVDPYSPKVVRSTMGAIFRVNLVLCDSLQDTLKEMKQHHFQIVTTCLEATKTIYDMNFDKKVIVMGNEANGVSEEILKRSDEKVIIPMIGKTESLNVSVATAVILYEAVRKKLGKDN